MDFSGWESPVNIIKTQMSMEIEGEIMRAVQKVGVIVDKEELIKALRYDRGQYNKGFENGYNKALDDFVNACKEDILCQTFGLHKNAIERISEQLREGGENEQIY